MKIVIASDIHGSAKWCGELVSRFEKENAERLIILGDVLYHGPRNPLPDDYAPQRVCELLNPIADKITAVRGNCDSEVDQMVLAFNVSGDYAEIYDGKTRIVLSHGHRAVPPMKRGDVYLTGHTHVPLNVVEEEGYLHLNPGSVSLPKENSERGYILYEDGVFTFKTLDGKIYDKAEI